MVDYSKWKSIEVSDDEDDTHPNIDTGSLFRWRHQARVERMEEAKKAKQEFRDEKRKLDENKMKLEQGKLKDTEAEELKKEIEEQEKIIDQKEAELLKKERLTPWNVDTIGSEGFSRTVINRKNELPEEELTDQEKAARLQKFSRENEDLLKQFSLLRRPDDSKQFLLNHPQLAHEDTANYLTIECINLAIQGKIDLMKHVSHQCICIQFLTELAKQLKMDPRSCISSLFAKMKSGETFDSFEVELELFQKRILARAEQKVQEAEEEERKERLGPGGLDPVEVMKTLPEAMQKCFLVKDVKMLQETIQQMPEEDAVYHIKRCVDSGLWVPHGADEKGNLETSNYASDKPQTSSLVQEAAEK